MKVKYYKPIRTYSTTYKWNKEGKMLPSLVSWWIIKKFRQATELVIEATHMWRYLDKITFDFTKDERKNEK